MSDTIAKRDPFVEQVMKMKMQSPPEPWQRDTVAIGGLTEVGYAPDTDYLLVISENRGVLDCSYSGKMKRLVARDSDTAGWNGGWRNHRNLTAIGIGPIEGQIVSLTGIWGGGLNITSLDGWRVELVSPNWPLSSVILCPPDCYLFHRGSEKCVKVAPQGEDDEIRAYGFSQTGKSFIIAMSHTIEIFSRL